MSLSRQIRRRVERDARRRLRFEPLEERRLLAITVDTHLDVVNENDGVTSLREAIVAANSLSGGETIDFAPGLTASGPVTLLLTEGELTVTDSLTINGPGADLLTIDASGNDPTPDTNNRDGTNVFVVDDGDNENTIDVSFVGVAITGADGPIAAVYSRERLQGVGLHVHHNAGVFAGGVSNSGSLTLIDSVIANNTGLGSVRVFSTGGIGSAGNLSLLRSTIYGNSGFATGGILAYTAERDVEIADSTISDNNPTGVLLQSYDGGAAVFRRTTITKNHSRGVFLNGGEVFFDHSIVAGNTGLDYQSSAQGHRIARYTLLGNVTAGEAPVGSPDENGNLVGGPIHGAIDPLLGTLAHNGGLTPTHAVLPGSPAMNAGDPSAAAGTNGVPEFDQRGMSWARVVGGRIEMGAVESQPNPLPGDYNFNGIVDAADYAIWRRTRGSTSDLRADGNGDGTVNDADYNLWRASFGSALPDAAGAITAESSVLTVQQPSGDAQKATVVNRTPPPPRIQPSQTQNASPAPRRTNSPVRHPPSLVLPDDLLLAATHINAVAHREALIAIDNQLSRKVRRESANEPLYTIDLVFELIGNGR